MPSQSLSLPSQISAVGTQLVQPRFSSIRPSQSSSTPLHAEPSLPGVTLGALHSRPAPSARHCSEPSRWHAPSCPLSHVPPLPGMLFGGRKSSSVLPSQSSSLLLQVST